jgi:hypothetical protein
MHPRVPEITCNSHPLITALGKLAQRWVSVEYLDISFDHINICNYVMAQNYVASAFF